MLKLKYMILVQLVIVGFILATTKADEEISHYGNYIVILIIVPYLKIKRIILILI